MVLVVIIIIIIIVGKNNPQTKQDIPKTPINKNRHSKDKYTR